MLWRLPVVIQHASTLVDCEADLALEYLGLGSRLTFLSGCSRLLLLVILALIAKGLTILVASLARIIRRSFLLLTSILVGVVSLFRSSLLLRMLLLLLLLTALWLDVVVTSTVHMLSEFTIVHEDLATDFTGAFLSMPSVRLVTF